MSLTVDTQHGPVEIPEHLVRALGQFGKFQAALTAQVLFIVLGKEKATASTFPAAFLLELGAIIQLYKWEMDGILPYFNAGLPTTAEAVELFLARQSPGLPEFSDLGSAWLSRKVIKAWVERCVWATSAANSKTVLVDDIDEDTLIDAIAPLLWRLRNGI